MGRATFELFVRHLPQRRNYLVAAGLEQALEFLENVHFTPAEIDYLRRHRVFSHVREEFFAYLAKFRFTGDVWAMPEGTLVFPGEPMLRVTAPIIEGQILETLSARDAQLPDHGREQGGTRGDGGEGPPDCGLRSAPRSRQPGQPCWPRALRRLAAARAPPTFWPASSSA